MIVNLTFPTPLNVSLQIGDLIYFATSVNSSSGYNHWNATTDTKAKLLGEVVAINGGVVSVDNNLGGGTGLVPGGSDIIMFQKDKRAGVSGIIGYYALTEYRNYSTAPAEIFATAVDYVESSK